MRANVHVPTYRSWQMMKNRCTNPNATDYAYYGGAGVLIPLEWNEYDGFLADMGERPANTTLERINGNHSYSKLNCQWATRRQQSRNREYTLNLEFNGISRKTWEWAEVLGVKVTTMYVRLWKYRSGRISKSALFAFAKGTV